MVYNLPEVITIESERDALALKAQDGTEAAILALWQAVRPFVTRYAFRWLMAWHGRGGVQLEDLQQEGFIALLMALNRYQQQEQASFLAYYKFYLLSRFADVTGCRTRRRLMDPLDDAESLDQPLRADDPDAPTLGDLVPDRVDRFSEVEDQLFREKLAAAVADALEKLATDEAAAIRGRFFCGLTRQQLGPAATAEPRALRRLGRNPELIKLAKDGGFFNPYRGVSVETFQRTHTSSVERDALRLLDA